MQCPYLGTWCTLLHCGHNPVHQVRPSQLSVEKTQCHVKERPWSLRGALDPVLHTFIVCVHERAFPYAIVSNDTLFPTYPRSDRTRGRVVRVCEVTGTV